MKVEKVWSEERKEWIAVVELWSEEEKEWRKEIVNYIYGIGVDDEQFQGVTLSDGRVKVYHNGLPWIADKWYKEITINSTQFSRRPIGERTYEVMTTEGKKGLYISTVFPMRDPKQIIPAEFDMIRTTSMAIGVRKDGKSGLYSYEGKIIVPIEYSRIITGKKVIVVIKNEVEPWEDKYAIFGDKDIGLAALSSRKSEGIYGVYSYDGKHILEDIYVKIEEKSTGIKAWVDEKNYKMFSYDGEEM
ncbi:MAG: hypothetical protein HFJ60_07375 [Clostridia bacterium]|jgi:hypothetical protein|nr:hypothetical protein [Clostridia bacterium]